MSKAIVCMVFAIAFIIILVVSCRNITKHDNNHKFNHAGGLNRRLGLNAQSIPIFDPLVAKIDNDHEGDVVLEGKEFFNDEDGRLNVSMRLMVLFPILDNAPKDGFIDSKELEYWIVEQARARLIHRTRREMKLHDKNGDGKISFLEQLPQFTNEDMESKDMRHGAAGWWMEQFKNADFDKNGTLDLYEFRHFLHPEDSNNENIQMWLLKEKMRLMDHDKDKRLNFPEFEQGAYDSYKTYVEFEDGKDDFPRPVDLFTKLDTNNNRFLEVEELKPMVKYLIPGELIYGKYYSGYLMREADDNKDGKLTLEEMLKHDYNFYNTVYDNVKHNYDVDDTFRDEL